MDLYAKVVKEVEASPSGPQIGAFFDFDGTIIYGYSATTYLREQLKRGYITPRQLIELSKALVQFGTGNMGFSAMMMSISQYLRGIEEAEYLNFGEELYRKHIAKLVYPESRALIEAHLRKGHTVALVSAATPYQVVPAARELGIEHVKCTHLEVVDGQFTGAVMKPTCYGMGKVDAAEQLAEEFNLDINQSYFYSDSDEDIQLLEYVGKPRPLNPNARLRRIARGRGWPVRDFSSRGKVGVRDYVRTFAAQSSMLTSLVAGIPIYAMTGSMNKMRNFSISLFADTASAIAGIELDITGEENLWANRPCVFIFNHQSQADVIILPALLRRDLAGVGKKEIGDVPLVGRLMKIAGTVLIDRQNSRSARAAMKPLVDVMLKEGRSVCIAPEGTRSTSTNLGRFKKGAFHLAMQAGVPIVPIVIHNAIDVAARGEIILRPATVKVVVLPAVDTSQWSGAKLSQHVDDVRDLFLEELDQMEYQNREAPKLREVKSTKKTASQKRTKRATGENVVKLASGAAKSIVGKAGAVAKRSRKRVKSVRAKKAALEDSNVKSTSAKAADKVSESAQVLNVVKADAGLKKVEVKNATPLKAKVTKRKPNVVEAKRTSRRRTKKKIKPKVSAKQLNDQASNSTKNS